MVSISIKEVLSEAQGWQITEGLDFIEEFIGDPYRLRMVYKNGLASHWFSRHWELTWDHVKPAVPFLRLGEGERVIS